MGYFRVLVQVGKSGHNGRDAGLIICPQKGAAVRGDDRLALGAGLRKGGVFLGVKDYTATQFKNPAVVLPVHLGIHMFAGDFLHRVHVGHKAD